MRSHNYLRQTHRNKNIIRFPSQHPGSASFSGSRKKEVLKVVDSETTITLHYKAFGIGFVSEHNGEYFLDHADGSILCSVVIDVYAVDDKLHVVTDK